MSATLTMLQSVYAGPSAPKRMARDARVSHRTAEKWWAGLTVPGADVLLRIAMERSAEAAIMRVELARLLGDVDGELANYDAGRAGRVSSVARKTDGGQGAAVGAASQGSRGQGGSHRDAADPAHAAWTGLERRAGAGRRAGDGGWGEPLTGEVRL